MPRGSVAAARAVLAMALTVALVGCFAPTERDGTVSCGVANSCPSGFGCVDGLCWRGGSDAGGDQGDGAPIDAPPVAIDAPPGAIDAPPGAIDATPTPDGGPMMPACSDGIDNDCDGFTDFAGGDPGCAGPTDLSELGTKQCDDGVDNDGDGAIDFHAVLGCGDPDPQCSNPTDNKENM